jgi:hypothetical protein
MIPVARMQLPLTRIASSSHKPRTCHNRPYCLHHINQINGTAVFFEDNKMKGTAVNCIQFISDVKIWNFRNLLNTNFFLLMQQK